YACLNLYSGTYIFFVSCEENHHPALLIEFTAFKRIKISTGPGLESLVDQTISVITNDGRNIVGVLKGFDQATNIILDESHERVYSTKEGVQQLVLCLYIIRGDNIVVGELDEELDSALDLSNLRAHPLKPVIH
ncbi:sm-like protein LSM8, partial [Hibiscus syriacus]|uniref:sm-like protein LSM8 n=1 Tax=Hibiscus syriacus TaxID=106335 RepID=UPI00192298FA